jgi:hypothetical protein
MRRSVVRIAAVCLATIFLFSVTPTTVGADSKVLNDRNGNPFMEEAAPANDAVAWHCLYSSYSCVYHHNYALATRWLLYALKQGVGGEMLRARTDIAYLSQGLSAVAAKRKEAAAEHASPSLSGCRAI